MKVKTISRIEDHVGNRDTVQDIYKVYRNYDPLLHPFERAREYTRALNATKLSRLFAKPFLKALDGHVDGVYAMAKFPSNTGLLASGAGDGEIRLWDLSRGKSIWFNKEAHHGFVRGLTTSSQGNIISVGDDKIVQIYSKDNYKPISVFNGKNAFTGVDHHKSENIFATSSTQVDIWDYSRSDPVNSYSWGSDTITTVKMNQTESNILASAGTDRSIILYDLRTQSPITKVFLEMRTNAISWNPMEPFNFSIANEDHNIYTFDMRRLKRALNIGKDHVAAVLDLDYSPTGQEIVTGSYDRTIRIFDIAQGRSREVYHTKRMQKIFTVKFSMDGKFVLSGSDDGNIRLWKANASEKLGAVISKKLKYSLLYERKMQRNIIMHCKRDTSICLKFIASQGLF